MSKINHTIPSPLTLTYPTHFKLTKKFGKLADHNTVCSRFKKARFKKESRFKKDCCYNRFFCTYYRAVARSENPGRLVSLWWAYSAPPG